MTDTSALDHAIETSVAKLAKNLKYAGPIPAIDDFTRSFCRDMIAELLRGMEKNPNDPVAAYPAVAYRIGYNNALRNARRVAGITETV